MTNRGIRQAEICREPSLSPPLQEKKSPTRPRRSLRERFLFCLSRGNRRGNKLAHCGGGQSRSSGSSHAGKGCMAGRICDLVRDKGTSQPEPEPPSLKLWRSRAAPLQRTENWDSIAGGAPNRRCAGIQCRNPIARFRMHGTIDP